MPTSSPRRTLVVPTGQSTLGQTRTKSSRSRGCFRWRERSTTRPVLREAASNEPLKDEDNFD
jgi:hypothetical protein